MTVRGQSNVVGVALLVAVTVVSVGSMTVVVGDVVERRADAAASDAAVSTFEEGLDPHRTGPSREPFAVPAGSVRVVDRTVRVRAGTRTVLTIDADAVVYRIDNRRVASVAGAIVRGSSGRATAVRPLSFADADGTVLFGVTALGVEGAVATDARGAVLRSNVTHDRRRYDAANHRIAIETTTPAALAETVPDTAGTSRRDFDGDGVPSLVVDPSGGGRLVVTVHRLDLEVQPG